MISAVLIKRYLHYNENRFDAYYFVGETPHELVDQNEMVALRV